MSILFAERKAFKFKLLRSAVTHTYYYIYPLWIVVKIDKNNRPSASRTRARRALRTMIYKNGKKVTFVV